MPAACSAINCSNRRKKNGNISFYKFPMDNKKLLKKWIVAMKRDEWQPTAHTYICSQHFEETCFRYNNDRRSLVLNSVPSIFNFSSRPVKKKKSKSCPKERDIDIEESNTLPSKKLKLESNTRAENEIPKCHDTPTGDSRYVTKDHNYSLPNPRKLKQANNDLIETLKSQKRTIATLRQRLKRKQDKLAESKKIVGGLRKRLSENGNLVKANCFDGVLKDLLLNQRNGYKNGEYPESVKQFAITLHFYSARAYRYIRKFVELPHPRIIPAWAQNIDASPRITRGSFNKIKSVVNSDDNPLLGTLMLDEKGL